LWATQSSKKVQIRDCLEGLAFDIDFSIPFGDPAMVKQLEVPLIGHFETLINEPVDNRKPIKKLQERILSQPSIISAGTSAEDVEVVEDGNHEPTATWKSVKSSKGIQVYRKRQFDPSSDELIEIHRAIISISCDATRVFNILSNPVHFRHVYESFAETKMLFESQIT
jgi:hypothetical protein